MAISRRQFLLSSAGILAASQLPRIVLAEEQTGFDYVLIAEEGSAELIPGISTSILGFNGGYPAPVLRAKQGKRIRIKFINRLKEPTTIHWHGIRIDIAMDGVPLLSQPPIMPGETFIYDFICPDAGTFWYHPHMNSTEQLGRGLVGALIVEEEQEIAFDADIPLCLKNWHIDEKGQFTALSIPRYAARMGTPGRYETANGKHKPIIDIPAGGLIRLRFINVDNTLIYKISLKDLPANIIAIDGNALQEPKPLTAHEIGAGMRLDIAFIAPEKVGEVIEIQNGKGRLFFDLLKLKTVDAKLSKRTQTPTLPVNPIPAPDLKNAETLHFLFEWAGAMTPADKKGKSKHEFWTINRRAWEGMNKNNLPAPLANLKIGKTYIFDMKNVTPHKHPIHMHGHTFTVLWSNKKKITPFHTDTVLMEKNERVKIAFVADNPGRWMFHCHVIEHMKTGLMGYITVA